MDNPGVHHATPTIAVMDPRGLAARGLGYWRVKVGQTPQTRVTQQVFDASGREVEQWDPRLSVPVLRNQYSLSGTLLAAESVDAGWQVLMLGRGGETLSAWDSRGTRQDREHDLLLRPLAVKAQAHGEAVHVVERFEYGAADLQLGNQCGRLIRHDDPAGTRCMPEYDVLGLTQSEVSQFLATLDPPDWPLEKSARDVLLEPGPGVESRWAYNSLGGLLRLTDAKDHRRHFTYTMAGQLKDGWLQLANSAAPGQCLVHDIRYNPGGKIERETAGNGVVTEAEYALDDGRLLRLCAGLPNAAPLQDLRYTVDPRGNIVQIDNHALPVRYHNNQRIDGQCTYGYDTLGQLTHASGWEAERSSSYPGTAYRASANPNAVVNYHEEYDYDAAGNLTELRHLGVQPFTRRWAIDPTSNRSLLKDDQPPDFARHFDANGNLQYLQPGQTMTWDVRNQLSSVSPVVREDEDEDDDTERYLYGGGGKRLRKVRTALAAARTVIAEVRYLPGLEIHYRPGGKQHEVLDLEAGRNRVKWLHGADAPDHSLRYHLTDHLRSGTLELDEHARVQSREEFYPFGGTAWEDHRDQSGAYKTIRYSGKGRDATGLYYYGYRYFAPWLCRWINPDPAGAVDGLNLYCFVGNSPVGRVDRDGRMWSGNELLPEDESQTSFSGEITNFSGVSADLPNLDIDSQDFQPQDQLAGVFNAPLNDDEAMRARMLLGVAPSPLLFQFEVHPAADVSPVAGPSSAVSSGRAKSHVRVTCNKAFTRLQTLTDHMRAHTGGKAYACTADGCDRVFAWRSSLSDHMHTHTGAKLYACTADGCSKAFAWKNNLADHMRTHTGEKPYACTAKGCSKAFAHISTLHEHARTHTGAKPYACNAEGCSKAFTRAQQLAVHTGVHRVPDTCEVPDCYQQYSSDAAMRKHQRIKHPGWQGQK
jgi:insecticidal toxin complex protein TccC